MIDKLVVLEDNYIVFGNEFVPAGTDVLEFVSILECKGFTLMIPGSDKDKFGNLRMLDVLWLLNLVKDHLRSLSFVRGVLLKRQARKSQWY